MYHDENKTIVSRTYFLKRTEVEICPNKIALRDCNWEFKKMPNYTSNRYFSFNPLGLTRITKFYLDIVAKTKHISIITNMIIFYMLKKLYLEIVPLFNYNISYPHFHNSFTYSIKPNIHQYRDINHLTYF